MDDLPNTNDSFLQENFEYFFEKSLSGFLVADPQGLIVRCNTRLSNWVGATVDTLKGKRFSDLFAIGSRIYYETHLWPLLRMQGFFDEVVVELKSLSGERLHVLVNALECRDSHDKPKYIHFTISKATDRLQYEQNLQYAQKVAEKQLETERENVLLREQLIAVLGHDLRNPLGAISMATELLEDSLLESDNADLLETLKRSSHRMAELINNIMDFARTRLGEGMIIKEQEIDLQPVLQQVVNELKLIFPKRNIITVFDLVRSVMCDPYRIAQLISNLLANALTHGAPDMPIYVKAYHQNDMLRVAVCNSGKKIPQDFQERLFAPFTREVLGSSINGLGLGLYISSEIARAHNGKLVCTSTDEETCFTFEMLSE